jgi:hypothetical protein
MPLPLNEYLQSTLDKELPNLRALTDEDAAVSVRGGWTRKQEIGHLIDSATNNHVRFVLTLEDDYRGPGYDQNGWVDLHGYQEMPWSTIVDFWYRYNCMLSALVARIPEARLSTLCTVGTTGPVTLRFLIEDYVRHMQHHIDLALGREQVTPYGAASATASKS